MNSLSYDELNKLLLTCNSELTRLQPVEGQPKLTYIGSHNIVELDYILQLKDAKQELETKILRFSNQPSF